MKVIKTIAAIAALGMVTTGCVSTKTGLYDSASYLQGDEITNALSGRVLNATNVKIGYAEYANAIIGFKTGGTISFNFNRTANGKSIKSFETTSGTWNKRGDQICYTINVPGAKQRCAYVYPAGDSAYRFVTNDKNTWAGVELN